MEHEAKIITFITLAQSIFDNDLKGITKFNCISFYHFLLDGLEKKRDRLLAQDDEKFMIYDVVIELLSRFDKVPEQEVANLIKYKDYFIDYTKEKTGISDNDCKKYAEHLKNDVLIKASVFLKLK